MITPTALASLAACVTVSYHESPTPGDHEPSNLEYDGVEGLV